MEPIRKSASPRCGRTISGSTEGCELRFIAAGSGEAAPACTPEVGCFLQLQLRAGRVENFDDWLKRELNNAIIESVDKTLKLPECRHETIATAYVDGSPHRMYCTYCNKWFESLDNTEYYYDIDNNVWYRFRQRANPDTCEHRVIQLVPDIEYHGLCVSCDSTIDPSWVSESHWELDAGHNWWVWTGPCNC